MKYLVTGGAGFIGSHIVDKLAKNGDEVIVIDNESSESHDSFYYNHSYGIEYHKIDINDHDKILPLFAGVDTVFHCAAESRIQPCILNPLGAVKTNSYGTCSVLQAARENSVRRVIYSSTSSAYGLANEPPNVETQPEDCLNPYSVSKVSGEKLCKMYYELYDLETIIFRYFNVYGERQPIRGQYAPVIGRFLDQYKNDQPLTIVPDGEQRRDYTHVSDVVSANILAASVDLSEFDNADYGEVFNVGTGTNHSVNELAELISSKTTLIEPRKGEARVTLANNEKLRTVMGWSPKVKLEDWVLSCKKQLG
jgi:UDP-glucose 4-epimerase